MYAAAHRDPPRGCRAGRSSQPQALAAARPLRLTAVEDAVRGQSPTADTGEMAGRLAVRGAVPLQFNAYKIPLMRNLVKRAIGGVEETTWPS